MTTLEFERKDAKYALTPDGKAKLTTREATKEITKEGTWSAVSSKEENVIAIDIGGDKKDFKVAYSFDQKLGNRNALKVEVLKEDSYAAASAIFEGMIELDDEKDITYRLPEGGTFVVYGELSFDGTYTLLLVDVKERGKTTIKCGKPEIRQGVAGAPEKSTLLTASAFTRVGAEGKEYTARIGVFGNLVPKDNKVIFMGALDGGKTFDITIAGASKVVNGALQISSDRGNVSFVGAVRYYFHEGDGSWGVMLGYSDKKFKLSGDIKIQKKTDGDGWTKFSGKVEIEHDGGTGGMSVTFELEGLANIDEHRSFQFLLKAGIINGKTTIDFTGTVKVDDKTIKASIKYGNDTIEIELAYNSKKIEATIRFLKNGRDVGIRFYVEYTLGDDGQQQASEAKAA